MKINKDLNVVAGSWWRWSHYVIQAEYIRPAPGARLIRYDPLKIWVETRPPAKSSNQQESHEAPYQSLLRLLGELRYDSPDDDPESTFRPQDVDLPCGTIVRLTEESEEKLLKWCAQYGLLGV